jgi:hypothetical protein
VIVWENSYGNPGNAGKNEESCTALAVDSSNPSKLEIVVIGESINEDISPCSTASAPKTTSNILFGLDFGGNVLWAKGSRQANAHDSGSNYTDIICKESQIFVSGNTHLNGKRYSSPSIYKFDHAGNFLEERYYDNGSGLYGLDALTDKSRIAVDQYDNVLVIGKIRNERILAIQSYPIISSMCNMERETIDQEVIGMPWQDLPRTDILITATPIKLSNRKGKCIDTDVCLKKKE